MLRHSLVYPTARDMDKLRDKYDLKLPQSPVARRKAKQREKSQFITARQLIGMIGSIILVVGVFTPIFRVPIIPIPIPSIYDMDYFLMGNMNYVQYAEGDGTIILILAVISLILVLIKKYKGLWFTGLGSIGVLSFTFIDFQSRRSQVIANPESELAGSPFRGLADIAIQFVELQWGWALLIGGAALIIASAAMKD